MEDYQKCLILLSLIIMYFYYINNRKETFENLDTFIKTTNNGQWNFSSYNPYANLKDYTDSFILLYSDNGNDETNAMGYKEILKYNKEKLDNFFNNAELNNQIKILLNKYNKTDNKVLITNTEFRKMGLEYVYTVPLITAYDKLNYIKNKTRLKTSINNFLIKDLRKYIINKYIEKKSITNQIDTDDSIIVELKYTLKDSKTINDSSSIDITEYTTKILKKIKKYLKFDIINNGTSILDDNTGIDIKFKIINYDNSENIVSIINTKIERLYDILFTEILNTNDVDNILHFIQGLISPEGDLKNISLYGSDSLKNISLDISPNCSVPSGDKIIPNKYTLKFNTNTDVTEIGTTQSNNLIAYKQAIIGNITDNSQKYNCNIYDIKYNLNGDNLFKLNIFDNTVHSNPSSVLNLPSTSGIGSNLSILTSSDESPCISTELDTSSTEIKTQLDNLSNIKGLDKRAKDNVKAILFANLNLESFKNHLNQNLKQKDYLIKLRIIGKAFNFLESIKDADTLNNSIVKQLKLNKENSIDITEDRLIAAVYYIIEKHLRENNNEFKLKEKLLFNNETLRKRSDIIKSYIPETTNSELEKLFFMTTREKIDYFDNNTNVRNTIELELKLIEKMKTSELETYFKEVNLLKKDVNDRLKVIISSNSNNILRIHKKLNNIAGGKFNKLKGGTNVCDTINSNNQEIGTLIKDSDNNFKINNSTLTEGESAIAIYDKDIIIDTSENDKISAYHHLKLIMKASDIVDIYKYNYNTKQFSKITLLGDSTIDPDGTLYKAHNLDNDNLLLHSYNNMTIKDVTSNINSMAYHNNKIYVVGNSGYFCVADLSDKVFNTVILKDKDDKITQNYENLNHICIDNDICLIVGDNGVYINGVLSSTSNTFKIFYCGEKKDFNECLIIRNSNNEDVKKYAIANNNELFQIPESECSSFTKLTIGGGENNNELIPIKLIDKNDISNITKGTVLNISIEKNSKLFKKGGRFIQRFPKGIKYIVEEFDPNSSELNIKMRLFWEGIDFGNDFFTFLSRMDFKKFPNNIEIGHIFNRNNELILNTNNSSAVVDIEKKKYTTSEILKIRNYYNGNFPTDVNKSNNNVSQGTVLYIESDEENQNLKSNRIKYIIDKIDLSNNLREANTTGRLFYEKSTVGDKELFKYKNFKNMFILTYKDDIFLVTKRLHGKKATIYKNLTPEEYNKYNEKHLYNDVNSVKETIKKGTVLNATFSNNPHFPDQLEDGLKFIVESTTPNLVVRRFWEDIDLDNESDNKKMIEFWTHPDRVNDPRLITATIDIENNKIKLNIAHEYFFVNIEETLTDDEIQTKRNERIASISDNTQKGGTTDYKLKNLTKLSDTLLFLKINNTNTQLWYLNTTNDTTTATDSTIAKNCDNMFIGDDENNGLYLIYIKNKVITFDSITINSNKSISVCDSNKVYKTRLYLDTNERITSLTVNTYKISMITNKLNYYKFNNPYNNSNLYWHRLNMKIESANNIEKPKLFSIPSNSTDYINLFNYGTAGQIINYNINNINLEDIQITNNSPIFSGYDNNNNAVFTFNTNKDYPKMFTLTYTDKNEQSATTKIRLYDNQNSYLYKNNKRIIRYNNYTPDITNYDIKVFSIRNNNYVNIPVSNTNNYNLLSNNVNIKINKFTEINKNEFVSLALFINKKFKIWLKPELDNNFNSYTYILDFKNNTSYEIKLYINGRKQSEYTLNKPKNDSVNISAIIYNGMNIYNNDTISLTDVSVNKLNLFIVPESESASVLYEKSYVSNKLITNIDKNDKMISIGIKNGTQFKLHNIKIVSSNKIYTNLTDYELNYLLEIDVNKAYNYLKKVNKFDLTIRYLLEKYRVGEEEDVQIYLSLVKSKSERDNLQNTLINSFTDEERTYYINNYLNSNKKYNIPKNEDSSTTDTIVDKIGDEKNKLLESLKIKLNKLKIEKEILSNQYKIEQRNRMFEKMDADKLVKKEDINKLEEEITDVDNIIKESEKKSKSKSFFSKLLSFFSIEETNDLSLVERLTQEDKEKIVEKKLELKQQLEEMNNEEKLKEIQEEYNINLEKLRLENKVKLERERNNLEEKIKNGEINAINGDLEIKKDIIENEKINLEMDKLFNVQKNLIKKQKSLLKIIKPKEKILPKINNKKLNTLFTKIDKTMNESNNFQETNNNLLQTNQNTNQQINDTTNIVNTQLNNIEEKINTNNEADINTTKNIIKDFKEAKKERAAEKDNKIKTDILNDIDSEIKKEKLIKKGKKPCVSFIDCYFKGLDDSFYTSYKKENTFIKDSSLPKTKKPTCKPKKDCNICYLETEGVPNSIIYNNSYSNNSLNLNIKNNINSRFMNDYTDLPDCPFDTCMSCENINNYSLFNNKTFNDKLMKKYTKN